MDTRCYSKEQIVLFDEISARFIPTNWTVIMIAPDLDEVSAGLNEGRVVHKCPLRQGEVDGLGGALSASPSPDMAVVRYGLETLVDARALFRTLAKRRLPVLCTYFLDDSLREVHDAWAPWRQSFDAQSFRDILNDCGYHIEIERQLLQFSFNMLFPDSGIHNAHWWASKEGKQFLARRKKRAERLAQHQAAMGESTVWNPSPKWEERAVFVADLIPRGLGILDLGCGNMALEKHVGARVYTPLDRLRHDDRTVVVDLNNEEIPEDIIQPCDLVTALGVFEYLNDPTLHLRAIAKRGKPVLCTYNVDELRNAAPDRMVLTRWASRWTTDQVIDMLTESGFTVKQPIDYGSKQKVFIALPRAGARQAWWDLLGEDQRAA